jgi:hypothetical protein
MELVPFKFKQIPVMVVQKKPVMVSRGTLSAASIIFFSASNVKLMEKGKSNNVLGCIER